MPLKLVKHEMTYDQTYINHLTNKTARLYKHRLELLGLWHVHPSGSDTFSTADDRLNTDYASLRGSGAISGLVNLDPQFRLTMYHVTLPLHYTKVSVHVGDSLIPQDMFAVKSLTEFLIKGEGRHHPLPPLSVPRVHPLEATMSNPHYTSDLRLLDGNWDLKTVMNSQTIILVTGVKLAIELLDRPVAERLRDEIDKLGDISLCRRALIVSDALWFNDATLHTQPVIAIGGPSSNALTRLLADQGDTWHTEKGFQGSFIEGPPPQVALWGRESAQVRDHVETWIKIHNGLSYFLKLCWR
jgi:hypothetical protein